MKILILKGIFNDEISIWKLGIWSKKFLILSKILKMTMMIDREQLNTWKVLRTVDEGLMKIRILEGIFNDEISILKLGI